MIQTQSKKNRINLADYPFEIDIQNRLFMADLNVFEVNVIQEIIHHSLKIEIDQFAQELDCSEKDLRTVLVKLSTINLLQIKDNIAEVNKEMRKYLESEILKFDNDFRCDMEFLKNLLSKVPIHVLPQWYPIPKTSDDIFLSIIEKFLLTPKLYQKYLDELVFDDPIITQIMSEVFKSPDFKVHCKKIMSQFSLTRDKLEEYLLILEFNLACCLSYSMVDGCWQEVITPFYEWKKYLQFEKDTNPKPIQDVANISRTHPEDFGFVQDITRILLAALDNKIKLNNHQISLADASKYLLELDSPSPKYVQKILDTILTMKFGEINKDQLQVLSAANDWIKKPLLEQAMLLYRFSGSHIQDKDVRAAEKSLKKVLRMGWIYFDDFIKSFTAPIGQAEPITLQCKGKRWSYSEPKYTKENLALVENTIFGRLFDCGMVCTGMHNGKGCFMVTPFGRSTLD